MCCVADYEKKALSILPRNAAEYYKSGACAEFTLNLNRTSFKSLRVKPRMLRDVSKRTTKTKVLGEEISMPIGVSPTAMQRMAHPEGEVANARAVGNMGSIFTLSTLSTSSLEDVAKEAPDTIKWFQLYIYKDRECTLQMVKRAENAGFKALVLTVDACIFGLRYADIRNQFTLPPHLSLANFGSKYSNLSAHGKEGSSLISYVNSLFDDSVTWKDVKWLKSITKMPIVLKGILTAEDAKIALQFGVEGIIVSNHGARQLDTSPSSIEALPEIVKAVNGACEVYLDGGIRHGTDVLKALALGAKMVFVGRPALWGLTCDGQKGVENVLKILQNEFEVALALTGCCSVADITPDMVVHESYYAKM